MLQKVTDSEKGSLPIGMRIVGPKPGACQENKTLKGRGGGRNESETYGHVSSWKLYLPDGAQAEKHLISEKFVRKQRMLKQLMKLLR